MARLGAPFCIVRFSKLLAAAALAFKHTIRLKQEELAKVRFVPGHVAACGPNVARKSLAAVIGVAGHGRKRTLTDRPLEDK